MESVIKSAPLPIHVINQIPANLKKVGDKIGHGYQVNGREFFSLIFQDNPENMGLSSKEAVGVGLFEDVKHRNKKGTDMDCAIYMCNHYGLFHTGNEELEDVWGTQYYDLYEVEHKRMSLNLNGTPLRPEDGYFKLKLKKLSKVEADDSFGFTPGPKNRDRAYLCIPKHWGLDESGVEVCLSHFDLYLNRICYGFKVLEVSTVSNGDWVSETISVSENVLDTVSGFYDLDLLASEAKAASYAAAAASQRQ